MNIPALAACSNPSPLPTGFAAPCPVFSLSANSVSQSQTLTLSATPQPGTDYILTTAYISQGTAWNPYTLAGNNAVPNYSSSAASLTLSSTQLSALSLGTHYTVVWDWLWDSTAQCYKGPGLNQCNTGQWRVQSFTITSTYVYSQSAYYTYSQSSYYAYSQAAYASAPVASLSPTSLTFPSQTVGITSPTQYVTLTNTGNAALDTSPAWTISGDFSWGTGGNCASSLAPGANCLISVKFTPTLTGTRTGTVTLIYGNAPTQTVPLTGTGVSTYAYSQSAYYAYSQSAYYTYSQSAYSSGANNYYVSTTGSDSNPGTQALPWKTLQHAADSLVLGSGGAIVHVASGIYNSTTYCSTSYVNTTAMVCVTKSGTASQPITFISDQRWQAKLTCPSGNPFFVLVGSYIRVIGFDMTCPAGTFASGTYGNFGHNEYHNNYFHDFATSSCPSTGVLFGVGNNSQPGWTNNVGFVAEGNVIRHAGAVTSAQPQCNQMHAIYFAEPYDVVTNNVISGAVGYGIVLYGGGVCHETIANNTVFNNSQGGIRIENVGDQSGYWDECANGAVTDYNTVINNLVVNNATGQAFGGGSYTGQGYGIDSTAPHVGTHNLYSNNLLYGNAPDQYLLGSGEIALNQRTGTDVTVFTNYQSDRNWAPAAGYNYQNYSLTSGSPAIDAGISPAAPAIDTNGAVRPFNAVWDIGAYEYGAAPETWPWY